MKAIKKENKNGTFRFELENGDVIIKSTKRNYNAFVVGYRNNDKLIEGYEDKNSSKKGFTITKYSATTKGKTIALELALNSGYLLPQGYLIVTV